MSQGGLTVVFIIAVLLNLSFGIYILVKYKAFIRASQDPLRANITKADLDLKRAEHGLAEYQGQVVTDLLRDMVKYSQEDFSELQGAIKELTTRLMILEGKTENQGATAVNRLDRIDNRLNNFLQLLSKIEDNTSK